MRYAFVVLVAVVGGGWLAVVFRGSGSDIQISESWVHETSASRATLHVRINNSGMHSDQLMRAATRVAADVAIRDVFAQPSEGLILQADSELVFGKDFPRMELIGLKESLKAKDRFQLLLVFQRAGKLVINVRVDPAPSTRQEATN